MYNIYSENKLNTLPRKNNADFGARELPVGQGRPGGVQNWDGTVSATLEWTHMSRLPHSSSN